MSPDDQHDIYETEEGYLQKSPYPTENGYPDETGYPTADKYPDEIGYPADDRPDVARVVGDADSTRVRFADGERAEFDVGIAAFLADVVADQDEAVRIVIDDDLVTASEE